MAWKGFVWRTLTRTCRHCGKTFTTRFPAQRTCKRPGCVAWSKERKRLQNYYATKRWRKRVKGCQQVYKHINKEY